MQYPTLMNSTLLPGHVYPPQVYPGVVNGTISLDYWRFHKTWTRSDNFEAQTAGLLPEVKAWLVQMHDERMCRLADANGFGHIRKWWYMTFHLARRVEEARIQAARMDAARMNADRMMA